MKISDAIQACERAVDAILDSPLTVYQNGSEESVFEQEKIEELRQIAGLHRSHRRRKNFGVIGGSLMGIAGGGMGIAGVVLAPLTFGVSLGLLVAGAAVGFAGSGISIGFSAGKYTGDQKRITFFKATCETYIEFVGDTLQAMVTLHAIKGIVEKFQQKATPIQANSIVHRIERLSSRNFDSEGNIPKLDGQIKQIREIVDDLAKETKMLLGLFLSDGELTKFTEDLENAKHCSMESMKEAIPLEKDNEEELTYRKFTRMLLGAHALRGEDSSMDPTLPAKVGRATAKGGAIVLRTGKKMLGARRAAKLATVTKAASTAGIVLGAIGIAADVGFLAEAVYDLRKENEREQARQDARNKPKVASNEKDMQEHEELLENDFILGLLDLADIMETVNDIATGGYNDF